MTSFIGLLGKIVAPPLLKKLKEYLEIQRGVIEDKEFDKFYKTLVKGFVTHQNHLDQRQAKKFFKSKVTFDGVLFYLYRLTDPEPILRDKTKEILYRKANDYKITESAEVTNSTLVDQFLEKLETELKEDANKSLLPHFADVRRDIAEVKKITATIKEQLKTTPKAGKPARKKKVPPKIYLAKLPITGHDLFGREKELKMLDKAWAEPHTNIFSLVAWGGVGKSALVNSWLNSMELDNYRGAERVYAWSFYSQGTSEERQVSADEFFADALEWFGYDGPPILSPWDKGKKLAELVRAQRTLLILDGLEPLQYPPGEMQGRLKDQGLQALLKDLARANPGLCVISTRLQVEDLEATVGHSSQRVLLENLSQEAGALLLQKLGVKGTQVELTAAAKEYDGHALALNLLGNYLKVVHGGEIRKRDKIAKLTRLKKHQGRHARRVMASYEKWFRSGAKLPAEAGLLKVTSSTEHGSPELNILYLMGLFDRPAEAGAIAALRTDSPIAGLTTALQNLSDDDWQLAVSNLRDLRLLAAEEEARPDTLDCHPLVREHFGEQLQKSNKKAWCEAHSRLYDYYKNLPEKLYNKELPDTLPEMEPLFAAVAHGCLAGKHQEAFKEVHFRRICRGNDFYVLHNLGAYGAELSALSNFFETIWSKLASELRDW